MYSVLDETTEETIYSGDDLEALEKALPVAGYVEVSFPLQLSLCGVMSRSVPAAPVEIVLMGNGQEKRFTRKSNVTVEGWGVTYESSDPQISVTSINVEFRPFKDRVTDRGLVWVKAGEPAVAYFSVRCSVLSVSNEQLSALIVEAQKAVEEKFLKHFRPAAVAR